MSNVPYTRENARVANLRSHTTPAVLKFGGTSVKSIGRIHHVADIIEQRLKEGPVIVVVSAMGDTTDHLIDLAYQCCPNPDPRELDQLIATGEQVAISLLAMCLLFRGIKARSCTAGQAGIFAESCHTRARIEHVDETIFASALNRQEVLVVAGFQGLDAVGDLATLGRGGSDTTAVAIAARLNATCDIYTDVDGVFTADPNSVPNARLLSAVPSRSMLALARAGASILHPRAVELARRYNVCLRIRNTFAPDHAGTVVYTGEQEVESFNPVTGVASDTDVALVALQFPDGASDVPLGLLKLLADSGITCDVCASSPSSISLLLPAEGIGLLVDYWNKNENAIRYLVDGDVARVSLVGFGLPGRLELYSRLIQLLEREKVSVRQIISSEERLTLVVKECERARTEKLLHDQFVALDQLRLVASY